MYISSYSLFYRKAFNLTSLNISSSEYQVPGDLESIAHRYIGVRLVRITQIPIIWTLSSLYASAIGGMLDRNLIVYPQSSQNFFISGCILLLFVVSYSF